MKEVSLGEEGKFCGFTVGGERRRCPKGEYCGTALGGNKMKEYACLKLTPDDAKVNGLCTDEKCSCGLFTCEKGEICHNNNPAYLVTHVVSVLTKEIYPLMCTK